MKAMTWMLVLCSVAAGCGPRADTSTGPTLPASFLTAKEPAEARNVAELRSSAKEGDVVTVRGIVGGAVNPVVAGRAVFTIGDVHGLDICRGEGETCATPWDACSQEPEEIAVNTLTVHVVDADGRPLAADVTSAGIKPLVTVVVTGKVGPRPDPNVFVVEATSVYVAKP